MLDNTLSKVVYTASGTQRQWDIPFEFYKIEDVHIYITSDGEHIEEIDQNYYYDEEGKFFIYPTEESKLDPIPAGTQVLILRETENTQLEDSSEIYFKSKDVERGLDNLTMQVQDLKRDSLRAVKLSHFATQTPEDFAKGIFEAEKRATEAASKASLSEQNAASSEVSAVQASASAAANAELAQNAANGSLQNAERAETAAATAVSTAETFKNKIVVIEASIDANADAIQKTRSDFMESDSELQQQINAHASELYTHKNDIDELGDQVAEIESKIPATASASNQLADKQYVNDAIAAGGGGGGGSSEAVWGAIAGDINAQTDLTNLINNTEIGIRADVNEADSELQAQITSQATAIAGKQDKLTAGEGVTIEGNVISAAGGGGSTELPDNVYTEDNLIAGENVTFDKKSGTDDNTVALFHFDGNAKDVVSGKELSESPVIATEGKFGAGSLKTRENWFNSVSFAKSIDPKTTPFTLEFWHKQVKGTTTGTWGDETTIVLAPTAPNNTASKSQWVGLFMLPDGTNNKIQLQIGDSRLGEFRTGSYTTLGEYNHYALTWDPSTQYFKLYMNGTYVDQYQYYYYSSLPVLGGIGMFKYTTGTDDNTVAQAYIDELRFSDTVRYTGNFTVATEAFPSDKLKTVVNVNVPEGGFNKDNLLGGKDIEIIPEPVEGGIDEHTVACWHFDGNQKDEVNGLDFYTSNGTYVPGKFGQALTKNSNNYTTSSEGLLSDKIKATSDWTVDFWVSYESVAVTTESIINIGTGGYNGYSSVKIGITLRNSQSVGSDIALYAINSKITSTKYTFEAGRLYHFAFQKKENIVTFFINGEVVLEYDVSVYITRMTYNGVGFFRYFTTAIDEVRISDVARYNGDFTPPTQAYRLAVPTGKYQINYTGESGAGKNIGEVYYSQSSLATDNAGALPLFTGETIASADTIYPEFYSWVESHTELQTSIQEYNKSIQDFGECPKYVLNGSETRYYWTNASYTNLGWQCYTLSATPAVGDVVWLDSKTGTFEPVRNVASVVSTNPYTWAISNETLNGGPVTFTGTTEADGVVVSLDDGSLRLPKKSLSHGTVVKEKKPTDIDPTWYRQWSDGWLEQGGLYLVTSISTSAVTITMPKQFADIYYNVQITSIHSGTRTTQCDIENSAADLSGRTVNSFKTFNVSCSWEAKGQGADRAQDETLYPWIFAYNASVPASTAQAAEFQEGLSGKADTNLGNIPANYDYVVETYNDGTNWYRLYKSGCLEQGGRYETAVNIESFTFLKPFAEIPTIIASPSSSSRASYNDFGIDIYNLTTTGFTKQCLRNVGTGWGWIAKGYIAQGA